MEDVSWLCFAAFRSVLNSKADGKAPTAKEKGNSEADTAQVHYPLLVRKLDSNMRAPRFTLTRRKCSRFLVKHRESGKWLLSQIVFD